VTLKAWSCETLAMVALASAALLSCSPNRKPFSLEDFQILVFPGEAELGGTAFVR
jgi:hypothetical protein